LSCGASDHRPCESSVDAWPREPESARDTAWELSDVLGELETEIELASLVAIESKRLARPLVLLT